MSDAERPGKTPERLDWGEETTGEDEPTGDDRSPDEETRDETMKDDPSPDSVSNTADDSGATADPTGDADAERDDLCVIEDPTCEACQ